MGKCYRNILSSLVACAICAICITSSAVRAQNDFSHILEQENEEGVREGTAELDLINEGAFPVERGVKRTFTAGALSAADKEAASKAIHEAFLECKTQLDVERYGIHMDEVKTILEDIVNENPSLFYVNGQYSYLYRSTGIITELRFSYNYGQSEVAELQKRMADTIGKLLEGLEPSASDFEKALHVHDALALLCEYDMNYYAYGGNKHMVSDGSFTMKGALVDQVAVCQGYAMAYKYILESYLDVECMVVLSTQMDHAWNMVKLGSSYYHVDVTRNDPVPDSLGYAAHKYFLLSEQGIRTESYYGFNHVGLANDGRFDGAGWKGVTSAILRSGDCRYFIDEAGMISKFIINTAGDSYAIQTDAVRNIWETPNLNWSQCKLAVQGDVLYCNTKKGIYSINNDGSGFNNLSTWTGAGDVYGLAWKNGLLQFSVKTTIDQKAANQTLGLMNETPRTRYYVTFDARNGKDKHTVHMVEAGRTATLPLVPTRTGYAFGGWFEGMDGTGNAFTSNTPVNSDMVVYAKWDEKLSIKGKSIQVPIGKSYALHKIITPANVSVTYQSGNKKVAAVNAKGLVKAKKIGVSSITVASKKDANDKLTIKVTVIPKTPSRLKVKRKNNKVTVTWKSQKDVTGWEVYRSKKKTSGFKRISVKKGAKKTTYTDGKLGGRKTFYYKVRAYKTVKGKKIYSSFTVARRM